MNTFELITVDQDSEVIRIRAAIKGLKEGKLNQESERADLVKRTQTSIEKFQAAVVKKELGEISEKQLNVLQTETISLQSELAEYDRTNTVFLSAGKEEALNQLEGKLKLAIDAAHNKIDEDINAFIEETRLEALEPIELLKPYLKEWNRVLKLKANNSYSQNPNSHRQLSFNYEYPLTITPQLYNLFKIIELIGKEIPYDLVRKIDASRDFID